MKKIEKARQLLPWYITGKLSSFDMKWVKEAISSCPSLHEDYKIQQKLSLMVKKSPHLMDISVISTQEQRLDRVMHRIRAEKPIATVSSSVPFFSQIFENVKRIVSSTFAFPLSRWAFAAVASVVLIQVSMFSFFFNQETNDYTVMSDDIPVNISHNSIIISFDPKATEKERIDILKILKEFNGQVAEHSSGSSSYKLVFPKEMSAEKIDHLLMKMENNSLIQFAGKGI